MSGVFILGAGGHAKVVADILLLQGVEVRGFLDDDVALWGDQVFGLPVFGAIDSCESYAPDGLILGIGSNKIRKYIVSRLGDSVEALWLSAVHPTAVVARSAKIGAGTVVAANAVINPDTALGKHVIINTAATLDHDNHIEDFVHIAPGAHLAGNIHVGEGTLFGIGSEAIPGCKIGMWSVVGAGSTVITDIPDNVTSKGTPSRW